MRKIIIEQSITSVPNADEFNPFSRRQIPSINTRTTSEMPKFQKGEAAALRDFS